MGGGGRERKREKRAQSMHQKQILTIRREGSSGTGIRIGSFPTALSSCRVVIKYQQEKKARNGWRKRAFRHPFSWNVNTKSDTALEFFFLFFHSQRPAGATASGFGLIEQLQNNNITCHMCIASLQQWDRQTICTSYHCRISYPTLYTASPRVYIQAPGKMTAQKHKRWAARYVCLSLQW